MAADSRDGLLRALAVGLGRFDDDCRKRSRSELEQTDNQITELYDILRPCLEGRQTNSAVFLMGPRGCGKTHVLEGALMKLDRTKFVTVRLHGLSEKGSDDIVFWVKEIVRQLTLRRSHMNGYVQNILTLEEIFSLMKVEQKAILFILDDVDSMINTASEGGVSSHHQNSTAEKQQLLYLLLDRVGRNTHNLGVVCTSCRTDLMSRVLWEKRVKSRAEGVAKWLHVQAFQDFGQLVDILVAKLEGIEGMEDIGSKIQSWLDLEQRSPSRETEALQEALEERYIRGESFRHFARIFHQAILTYTNDVLKSTTTDALPQFSINYLLNALKEFGPSHEDSRIQALKDLDEPHVALLLAARRILASDANLDEEHVQPRPLTLGRILDEYVYKFKHGSGVDVGFMIDAFREMVELGIFRPSAEHSGVLPLRYKGGRLIDDMDEPSLRRLPLHMPLQLQKEFTAAVVDELQGPTELIEWGKRIN